jgi:predicted ATP-grasp superfamily ATP-dependent carboligase
MQNTYVVHSLEEALNVLKAAKRNVLLQEYIPGGVGSMHMVGLLYDREGKLRRSFVSRSIKTLYPNGGPATAGISVDLPELIEDTQRLLKKIGEWRGPVGVEWMLDPRDNKMKFIEINPRLWGYGSLATGAGINFPADTVELALGHNINHASAYRVGVTMIRTTQDLIFERCPFEIT